ncbi:universal stress protein [Natrinema gelatinilyticum]|uniref:universal stress protein n=1 Tax=Natrinema gelatinilyticum TaxID=2961571 RepID=UPI0020C51F1F|nr:universal stress protein [Natrinema gelatinilyticum]
MYRVLIPVDPDTDRAIAAAEAVTSLPYADTNVEVIMLSVFTKREIQDLDGGRVESEDLFERTDPPTSLTATAELLEKRGVDVSVRREHGDPAQTIVEIAADADVDNIVMGGRKRSPVGKVVFGSVTQNVVLNSSQPVTIVESK